MTERRAVIPDGQQATYDRFHFAPAFRVGDTIHVSGVIGVGAGGAVPDDASDEHPMLVVDATLPLHQWWRGGGWWVGNDSTVAGRLHTTSYISDNNLIYELPVSTGPTNLISTGHQALLWRP